MPGLLAVAFATAFGANVVNNIPMSLVVIASLGTSHVSSDPAAAFAGLIGTNVGPNVTVFGSLATMLVLHAARRRGIKVTTTEYLKVGLITTPWMIVSSTLVLWLLVR